MARTIEEIFEYLDDREAIAKSFANKAAVKMGVIPFNTDVRSVEMDRINANELIIMDNGESEIHYVQSKLDELDSEFQEAIDGESEERKNQLIQEYQKKREFIVEGIEFLKDALSKTRESWNRFKSGEILTPDDVYGVIKEYEAKVKGSPESDIADDTADNRPQDAPDDMSEPQAKTLAELMKELEQVKAARRRAERALAQQRFKEFQKDIEESGALYLQTSAKNKELKGECQAKIEELRKAYQEGETELDTREEALDTKLAKDRAELAKKKMALRDLRKLPIIQALEKNLATKERLQKELASTKDEGRKAELREQIETADKRAQLILGTDAGQEYKAVTGSIETIKADINADKAGLDQVEEERETAKSDLKTAISKAKEELQKARDEQLPSKGNRFMLFIGNIRAKLGIGKHKAEKNVADAFKSAITELGESMDELKVKNQRRKAEFRARFGEARDAVKGFFENKRENIISALETHIQNRITNEKQKAQDAQSKITPDAGDR